MQIRTHLKMGVKTIYIDQKQKFTWKIGLKNQCSAWSCGFSVILVVWKINILQLISLKIHKTTQNKVPFSMKKKKFLMDLDGFYSDLKSEYGYEKPIFMLIWINFSIAQYANSSMRNFLLPFNFDFEMMILSTRHPGLPVPVDGRLACFQSQVSGRSKNRLKDGLCRPRPCRLESPRESRAPRSVSAFWVPGEMVFPWSTRATAAGHRRLGSPRPLPRPLSFALILDTQRQK